MPDTGSRAGADKGKSGDVRDKTGGAPRAPVLITDKRRAFVFGSNRFKDGRP
ncbi:hypothetical protein FACS189494_03180 [Spirochaetia bacterium]|nr:hypothetical protein FACS189494_03180 [Spirochaetia bacterium]